MRWNTALVVLMLAGCDPETPPYDQLPLRDALGADPEAIAMVPDSVRVQLGARFESARNLDSTVDNLAVSQTPSPVELVAGLDRARQLRHRDAMVTGIVHGGAAWPIGGGDPASSASTLPSLEGEPASTTSAMEARALAGHAGRELIGLMAGSGAHHLFRMVRWPVAAVAVDDTVYVNGSWLVAMAPAEREGIDGGAVDGGARSKGVGETSLLKAPTPVVPFNHGSPSANLAEPAQVLDGVSVWSNQGDAGVGLAPAAPEPEPSVGDAVDACSGCAGACDQGSGNSCDSGDSGGDPCATSSEDTSDPCSSGADPSSDNSADSCDTASADSGSADGCNNASADSGEGCASAGDSSDAATCQVARGRGHKSSGTRMWLLAPLAYLLMVRRR